MRGPANSRVQQYPRLRPLLTGPRAWPVVCLLGCWEVHSLAGGCCHRRVWCCTCVCVWLQGCGRMLWAAGLLGVQQRRLGGAGWTQSWCCGAAAHRVLLLQPPAARRVQLVVCMCIAAPGACLAGEGRVAAAMACSTTPPSGGRPLLGVWGCMPWLRAPCETATHERNRWHSKTSDLLRIKQQSWSRSWPTAQGVRVLQRTAPAPPGAARWRMVSAGWWQPCNKAAATCAAA
jgi:hypothetical protein